MKKEPLVLNVESATGSCSVCISKGLEILNFQVASELFQHSEVLTGLIDNCLKESGLSIRELDALAVSSGPGSYTSLRVGLSTAKGICYALGKPLIGVSTLRALALAAKGHFENQEALYCPMIDARTRRIPIFPIKSANPPVTIGNA